MSESRYHEDLAHTPFTIGRHAQSIFNAGDTAQGSGETMDGIPNRLSATGIEQAEAIYPALAAAGIRTVQYLNSSEMDRAKETRDMFWQTHPDPKPTLAETPVLGLKEVSQKGWSGKYTREQVSNLRYAARAAELATLQRAGLAPDLEGYVAWITRLGQGEMPIGAALRGIQALEEYGPRPDELIFSHAMLNRYMDAIATRVPVKERERLRRLLRDSSDVGKIAVVSALKDLGVPKFAAADHKRNQQANGGVNQYTINHAAGLWIAGRRIEPPTPSDTTSFVEHFRDGDGMWTRLTPDGTSGSKNNE